jgi:5-methylcytosine-specific restriction protein B
MLDSGKTYKALLATAREHRLLTFDDLALANEVDRKTTRGQLRKHLGKLAKIGHGLGWPLLSSIVVEQKDLQSGDLAGSALKEFLTVATATGADVGDPSDFLTREREKVFRWAATAPAEPDLENMTGPRFVEYFGPVLDALRNLGGSGTPEQVTEWIRANVDIPANEWNAKTKGGNPQVQDKINWARFYLLKAGLIGSSKRGVWSLTEEGKETVLSYEQALLLFREIKRRFQIAREDEDAIPEDATSDPFDEPARRFWFVGASWDDGGDQCDRFVRDGIWENGYEDRYLDDVRKMRKGDLIAIKSTFTRKLGLPFDNKGNAVSCMRIKAIGTITANPGNGRTIEVSWHKLSPPRDWFFYTYRTTVLEADRDDDLARRLILFTFAGEPQDYRYWTTEVPYFAKKYGEPDVPGPADGLYEDLPETEREVANPSYTIENIVRDGCFIPDVLIYRLLERVRSKKNVVIQGPPGTGKTWLAKRLAYALIGSSDPKLTRQRLRIIQFHPSYSYEDFVCGWRPTGNGTLALLDGVFLQIVEAAKAQPDRPFVLVIEEINRGNPAQIFGEVLTLLEVSKRNRDDAMELAYHTEKHEKVYVPKNIHVIGTMNIADRSLALVDLALRRRFAFVDLEPQFNEHWRRWCVERCGFPIEAVDLMRARIAALNEEIEGDRALGSQFRIGHSYLTPAADMPVSDPVEWFRDVVRTEIVPLLEEYWFDAPEKASAAARNLLAG